MMKLLNAVLLICLILSSVMVRADTEKTKMTYLVKLADFIYWPGEERAVIGKRQHARFNICIIGKDPFQGQLAAIIRKQQTRTRFRNRLSLKYHTEVEKAKAECRLAFISHTEQARINELIAGFKNTAILTVSDMPDFIENGGMIRVYENEKGSISFDVAVKRIQQFRLKINANFLRLRSVNVNNP